VPTDTATLLDAFDRAVERDGDRDAYVDGTRRLTFRQWSTAGDAVAAALAERGVAPGDVVAIQLPPSIDFAIAYAGVVKSGAIVTGINIRLGPREIAAINERCTPAYTFRDLTGVVELQQTRTTYRRPDIDPDDPAVIIWTSGTSGIPKGAWFDHRNLAAAVGSAGVMAARHDRQLVATPFAHAGYMAKVWQQLETGSTMIISPTPWRAEETARLVIEEHITMLGAVPTQWAKLAELPVLATTDRSHLRVGVSATSPAPPELVERVRNTIGCPLIVRYAMTESPSITGTEPGDPPEVQFRTVGRPQAGVEVSVRDDTGAPLTVGEIGSVVVRGATVMRGYWNDPEQTAKVLSSDGWLNTGDLGYLTGEGNLVLVGRSTDMYLRGGYNVHPLEVEGVLAEHPMVNRAAVVGIPTEVIGEIGVAFVVPADAANPPSLDELRQWVSDRLADYKAPDRLELLAELPTTTMLKIDKAALRQLAMTALRPREPRPSRG
jgi:acyl-CoA synthetase (AMP-forming)/AMP-acid ligase II